MTTDRQRAAARRNIRKAQAAWRRMTPRSRARPQPQGRARARPGTGGHGRYYRIGVRPKSRFSSFRTQDVGRHGHLQRVAGRRPGGSWSTVTWLVSKADAHVDHGRLVADTSDARRLLSTLGSRPVHIEGDRFKARDRPNVPEHAKPTPAMRRARARNIRRAQMVRFG